LQELSELLFAMCLKDTVNFVDQAHHAGS
jgi:hypothetical protein